MRTRSLPLPFLPLEAKNDILRFCDPSTLAKTAQVSLAFLELSSPILYEDVHVHGFEGLKLLFSRRTQPPSLQTAPFLSLSQIRDLSIVHSFEDLEQTNYSGLSLDRGLSESPLALQNLRISIADPGQTFWDVAPPLQLLHLGAILNPRHLVVEDSTNSSPVVVFGPSNFSSLETILLVSVLVGEESLGTTAERAGWNLNRVTYDVSGGDEGDWYNLLAYMLDDLPFPSPSEVLVLADSEWDKAEILAMLRRWVEEQDSDVGEKALAQVKVEVREFT